MLSLPFGIIFFLLLVQRFIFRSRECGTWIFTLLLFMCVFCPLELSRTKESMIGQQSFKNPEFCDHSVKDMNTLP